MAHYAALIRHRPVSAEVLAEVLNEYFGLPVVIEPFVGTRVNHAPETLMRLGKANCELGGNAMLGPRYRRTDLKIRLRIGPLSHADYARFLRGTRDSEVLRAMLALFVAPPLLVEVRLVLRREDVLQARLPAGVRLGRGLILSSRPATADDDKTYCEFAF